MNLLIVNDEALTADTMKESITWENYGIDRVFVSYDAENARRRIDAGDVDLILCDIEMPGESGLALLKWAKENHTEVECVFLTCHASFDYAHEAIKLGCRDYILLPAKYADIGAAVKKAVDHIHKYREDRQMRERGELAVQEMIIGTEAQAELQKNPKRLIGAVKQYILHNLGADTLSVAQVAETFHFHPVYLNRIFRKFTDISVSQYIMDERMRLAKSLLEGSRISASAVAKRVGYSNYPNFSAAFKRYYGYSPSAVWRNEQK